MGDQLFDLGSGFWDNGRVKVRFFAGTALLIAAAMLIGLRASGTRVPWGFRGHQAVLLDTTGTVDVAVSEERRRRERRESATTIATPGLPLDAHDEVRVARFAEARLRLPGAEVTVRDGGYVVLGGGRTAEPPVRLMRGLIRVETSGHPAGTNGASFEVDADDVGASLLLRPGAGTAATAASVLVDASGMTVFVERGSAEVRSSIGEAQVTAGQVATVALDRTVRVAPAPTSLTLTSRCAGGRLSLNAPDGTQVFAAAGLHAIKGGALTIDTPGKTTVSVFARDVAGNVAYQSVPCTDRIGSGAKTERVERPGVPR